LVPTLELSSAISKGHCLQIFFNWIQPHDSRSAYSSVEYLLAYVELPSSKNSAPAFWQGVPAISAALLWLLSLHLVHYAIYEVRGYTSNSVYRWL
jgi:hypothetical protein